MVAIGTGCATSLPLEQENDNNALEEEALELHMPLADLLNEFGVCRTVINWLSLWKSNCLS